MRTLLVLMLIWGGRSLAGVAAPLFSPAALPFTASDSLPQIFCPADTALFAAPGVCSVPLNYIVTASDDTPGWMLTQTAGLASGTGFPSGITENQFTVTDIEGNTATCKFVVTVYDTVPPVALCAQNVVVTLSEDDPDDCFFGAVNWLPVSAFDAGSYDDCGPVLLTIRRSSPFSDCINSLNFMNGHPDCNDLFPDFPSEFETSAMEADSIKFYCCEAGVSPALELRAYQLGVDGKLSIGPDHKPVFSTCTPTVVVQSPACPPDPYQLVGIIDLDTNHDCMIDNTQFNIPSMVVAAVGADGMQRYANSDAAGYFSFGIVDSGSYTVTVYPASPAWQFCNNPMTWNAVQANYVVGPSVSAQIETDCPVLVTDLSTTGVRPCSTAVLHVRSCNVGGTVATGAVVQLTVDPLLTVNGASLPFTTDGNLLTIPIGNLTPGACIDFSVSVQAPCDPGLIGEWVCNEAHIFPDSVCLPPASPWSGAQIEVQAVCDGDSVRFTLQNAGSGATAAPLDYVIIDDMVIMLQGQLPAGFAPGAERRESLAATGNTVRLVAEQEINHPLPVPPSVAVEHCVGAGSANLLLAFPNASGNPFTDKDCRQIRNSYDPNEKQAFPVGYSDLHLIESDTRISYQLNFQNTGTDTAFQVILRDTLSPMLDPASLRMGASSHPYTWAFEGAGILTVRFTPILLPDSTVNEPGSHGFVEFSLAQRPGNPDASVIENRAGIYFDQNPVVLTNTVFHTIGAHFVPVATRQPDPENPLVLFPNPATEQFYLSLSGESQALVRLRDSFGRIVQHRTASAPGVQILRNGLPAGVYFVEVQDNAGPLRAGLMVWK